MGNYSLSEIQKTVVSLVVLAGSVAALVFTGFDPTLTQAVVVLTGAAFGAVGVFSAKNSTPDDWSKAVAQLQGAALSVVGYFLVVPADTVVDIGVVAAALLSVYGVYRAQNQSYNYAA